MIASDLEATVVELEPELGRIAEDLNTTPSALLKEAFTEQRKKWAVQKLKTVAGEAKASGCSQVEDDESWLERIRERASQIH